ncbi:GIY-YIG nuclease family protein, partial [Pararhodobacter sp.]|uniref:GIY-YIG nuclease family protein n=1 Tax=Pararhodobacter sp. TaxID=2127056 RepID=UPI002AFFFB7E
MAKTFTEEDDALLAELGIEVEEKQERRWTAREERVIAGFEDIQRFVEQHGHAPRHGDERDIFERLYAVRLDRLRELEDCRTLLESFDHQGLLAGAPVAVREDLDELDDDALLAELGIETATTDDITALKHVRPVAERRMAEEIANRETCRDFEKFRPLFEQVQRDLQDGVRTTRPFVKDAGFLKAEIKPGQFFILGGQTVYVAEVGETIKAPNGETDARLRAVYSNGTESDLLLRSLQRALYKDETGRRITDPVAGPLFADRNEEGDEASGTIYVLRSKSELPAVTANRKLLHKIGVTGGDVARRIANAAFDPTFLMADVEIVATYELYNINRTRLENLIHKVFGSARLDIKVEDRFGQPVVPREWFLVPLFVID